MKMDFFEKFNSRFRGFFNKNIGMSQQYTGFTLAEVLITLGIIGVIAVMVVPPLVKNYQDMQFKHAAKEAYSRLSQAVMQMTQEKDFYASYYSTDVAEYYTKMNLFKKDLMSHLKIAKDQPYWGGLVGEYSTYEGNLADSVYKTLNGSSADTDVLCFGEFVTVDGMFWGINNYPYHPPIAITVDVNGYIKGPNVYGRDVFMFLISKTTNQVLPMGGKGTAYPASTYCDRTISNVTQGIGCMYYVMNNIDY